MSNILSPCISYNVSYVYSGANPRTSDCGRFTKNRRGMPLGDGTLYDIMYHLNTLPLTNSLTHGILLGHHERILSRNNGKRRPNVMPGYDRTSERTDVYSHART